ncbi:MAG: hypothetical protein WCC26_13300 [Terracidiphilus sp.]
MYHQRHMRRVLAIFLALAFGLGPSLASLQAGDDARLPFCCRRHGVHHCAMAGDRSTSAPQNTTPAFAAPAHCPVYPGSLPATTSVHALAPSHAGPHTALAQLRLIPRNRLAPRSTQRRNHEDRGPPPLIFS